MINPGDLVDVMSVARSLQAAQRWHFVYSPLVVRATIEWIVPRGLIRVPEDVRELVETATHPDSSRPAPQRYGPEWQGIEATMGVAAMRARQEAQAGLIDRGAPYRLNEGWRSGSDTARRGHHEVVVQGLSRRSPASRLPPCRSARTG